jgi:NADH:ubiquinone reductase (non-electrogenic)
MHMQGIVKEVRPGEVELRNGEKLAYGLCVWSTGVGPTEFTTGLPFARTSRGRIAVDEQLRVLVEADEDGSTGTASTHGPGSVSEVALFMCSGFLTVCKL